MRLVRVPRGRSVLACAIEWDRGSLVLVDTCKKLTYIVYVRKYIKLYMNGLNVISFEVDLDKK